MTMKTAAHKKGSSSKAKTAAKSKEGLRAKAAKGAVKPKKLSAVAAAAKVLHEAKKPLNCAEMIEAMAAKGYWTSPGGKTPAATLYAAIIREIAIKGREARFKKTDRGTFAGTGVE